MSATEDAKKKISKILPNSVSKISMRIEIGPGGKIKISAISAIEDLLDDYEFFLNNAQTIRVEEEKKRFLRAACFSLNAYIEGSVNSLYEIHCKKMNISRRNRKRTFHEKCKQLEESYLSINVNETLSDNVRQELRKLRNELTHFSKGDNFLIWDNLSIPNLEHQKEHFASWLNNLYKHMNVKPISTNDEVDLLRLMLAKMGVAIKDDE